MGWWITLAVLVVLAILPLGVRVRYDADGIYLAVIAGPLRIKILPAKKKDPDKEAKKKKKPKKDKKTKKDKKSGKDKESAKGRKPAKKKTASEPDAPRPEIDSDMPLEEKYPDLDKTPGKVEKEPKPREESEEKKGGSWTDFLSLVPVVFDFLGDFFRKLRVDLLELKLILAADDPCDLAINYGKAWAALGNLLPQLERIMVIKKRKLEVECDFTASETKVIARMDLTITLGRLLACVCKFAFHAIKEYLKIMKKRKGGAVK